MGHTGSDKAEPSAASHWIVSLRAAAIAAGVFGFTCLGVLVVVTSVDGKDALSTVALALAILAFTVQLIVFVAQQNFASEQGRRNEELYGSMQGVLAEVREKAAGTQADVRNIRDTIFPALLSKERADPAGGRVDPSVVSHMLEAVGPAQARSAVGGRLWPERRPTPQDAELVEMLNTYPAKDAVGNTMEVLEELSPTSRMNLKAFGDDEVITRQPDSPFDPSLTELAAEGLLERELVEPYPADRQPRQDLKIMHLTDDGRAVARLMTASGDPPDYLPGLKKIREETPDRMPEYQGLRRRL
jgi:heme/copper-type cytochrome/quinol oxidase subunit 4